MSTLRMLLIGLGSRLTIVALMTLNTILLARWLGPSLIGEYFLLLRLVGVLTAVAGLGLKFSANVFAGHHEGWGRRIHNILLRFTVLSWIGTTIVGIGIMLLARDILLPDFPMKWVWMSFVLLPMSLYANVWTGIMIGRGRIWQLNLVQVFINAASLAGTLIFVRSLNGGLVAAVLIYLFVTVAQFFTMLVTAFRVTPVSGEEPAPADLPRQILSFGLRAYPGTISDLLWSHAPAFMLNAFYGAAAVGIFSVAQQLVEKLLLPILAMQDAIYKRVANLTAKAAIVAINRYVRMTSWVIGIFVLAGVAFVPWVIRVALGENYMQTAQLCRLLLPGAVITSICILLAVYFLGQLRRPGLLSMFGWGHALLNIVLSLWLIPKYAETGAALALVIAQILSGLYMFVFYLRTTRTSIGQLILVRAEDVTILRQQVGALFGAKGT